MNFSIVSEHLFLVLASGICSILTGLPLGIFAYMNKKARPVILKITDVFQTVPALALLGMIMVFAGPGKLTVIIGITVYSLLPIVRNTCLGLEQVSPSVREAAKGMGMSRMYRLFRVEFPIAFPTIFTGIRIAVINAIGTAVFAAFVGGGGLGGTLNRAIRIQDMSLLLRGTLALVLIAVVLDAVMEFFEIRIRKSHNSIKHITAAALTFAAAFLLILPFGISKNDRENEIIMYDGDYSETQLIHHMVKMLIEDKTDLKVTILDQMSQVNNFKALSADNRSCDLMISYDGTVLTTFLHQDVTDVPENMSIYDFANAEVNKKYGLRMLGKLGFDNTYAVAMPEKLAEQYGISTVSDLVPHSPNFVFGAEHEFFTREGSMKFIPFTEFYGLNFKDSKSVDVSLKYPAVESGQFDVTEVYATDGLNKKAGLKILEDDRNFFPDYNGALLIADDLFERYSETAPELPEVLALLEGRISNADMVNLTYEVDVMGKSVDEAAESFLREKGLLQQ